MERDYVSELKSNELYKFILKNQGCRIYFPSERDEYHLTYWKCNSCSVYFTKQDGYYQSYDMSTESLKQSNSKILLNEINCAIRIEKELDGKWLPVWTIADGFIDTDYQNFAYIGGRYYTFNELEQLIKEFKSLKQTVANLKIY